MTLRLSGWLLLLAGLWMVSCPVLAQDDDEDEEELTDYVPEEVERVEAIDGWSGTLTLGATVNVGTNSNVVGQRNGMTALLGAFAEGNLSFVSNKHEWNTQLYLEETFTRSPGIDNFIKSNDELNVQTLYNYFFFPKGGLFARAAVDTPLFVTNTQSPEQRVVFDENDEELDNTDSFRLAKALAPLTVEESAGLFAEPVQDELFQLSMRLGFGGRHTFADGSFALLDEDSDEVYVEALTDVQQAGVEAFVGIEGEGKDGRLTYFARTTVLWPVINNDDEGRDSLDLTRVAFQIGTVAQLFDWLDVRYRTEIIRDKQLIDQIQVAHKVTANLTYVLSHRAEEADEAEEDDER